MGRHLWGAVAFVLVLSFAFLNHVIAAEDGAAPPPATPTLAITETSLGKIDGIVENTLVVSPDFRHAACVIKREDKQVLFADGKELKVCDSVIGIYYSPDLKRMAYVSGKDKKALVTLDGQDGKEYAAIGSPAFSPNSKRFAYAAKREKDWVVVLDGVEDGPYESAGEILFSPDSKRFAYVVTMELKSEANPPAPPKKVGAVIVDGVAGAQYDGIVPGTLAFSADSKRVAYAAVRAGKQLFVVDGEEGKDCDAVSGFKFSDNSKHFAYAAMRDGKGFVVVDGAEETMGDMTGMPVFSADSKHLAYAVKKAGKSLVALDGTEGAQYDDVRAESVVFSPDSTQICYAAQRGAKWLLVTEKVGLKKVEPPPEDTEAEGGPIVRPAGVEGKEYDDILAGGMKFSGDGKHVVYAAKRGEKWVAVLDGVEGREYDDILAGSVMVSPDGAHVAYLARREAKWLVAVDGAESAEYDRLINPGCLLFDSPTKLHALLARGSEIFLIDIEVK
jgi:hypothetical protein